MKKRNSGSVAKLHHVFLAAALGLFAPIAAIFIAAPQAFAAGTIWNIDAAAFNSNTGCVIQDAITANHTGMVSGGCAAGTGGTGTINLGPGTFYLGADINFSASPINVVGSGVGVTIIDGGGNSQDGFGGRHGFSGGVNISNLTMQHMGINVGSVCPNYFAICTTGTIDSVVVKNSQGGIGSLNSDSISNVAAIDNRYYGLGFFDLTAAPIDGATNVSDAVSYGNSIGIIVTGGATPNNIIAANLTIANNTNNDTSQAAGISYSPGNLHLSLQNSTVVDNVTASASTNCDSSKPASSGGNASSDGTCGFSAAGDENNADLQVGSPTQNGSGMYVVAVTNNTPVASSGGGSSSGSGSGSSTSGLSKSSTPSNKTTSTPATPPAAQSKTSAGKSSTGEHTQAQTAKITKPASKSFSSHETATVAVSSAVVLTAVVGGSWWALAARPSLLTKLPRLSAKQKSPRRT